MSYKKDCNEFVNRIKKIKREREKIKKECSIPWEKIIQAESEFKKNLDKNTTLLKKIKTTHGLDTKSINNLIEAWNLLKDLVEPHWLVSMHHEIDTFSVGIMKYYMNKKVMRVIQLQESLRNKELKKQYSNIMRWFDDANVIIKLFKCYNKFVIKKISSEDIKEISTNFFDKTFKVFREFLEFLGTNIKGSHPQLFINPVEKIYGEFSSPNTIVTSYHTILEYTESVAEIFIHELAHYYEYSTNLKSFFERANVQYAKNNIESNILNFCVEGYAVLFTYYFFYWFNNIKIGENDFIEYSVQGHETKEYRQFFIQLFNRLRGKKKIEEVLKEPEKLIPIVTKIYLKYE